jgi:UrcA family protein
MTKTRIALFGSAMVGAALCSGVAQAQDYNGAPYQSPNYYGPGYEDRYEPADETIIVRPDYDQIEKHQVLGNVNGELNPTEFSISRPVSFSDLDLSRDADYMELRDRVRETARDLCAELDARVPDLRGDRDADRECIRSATRNAMADVRDRFG